MRVLLATPPMSQLNTPYPATTYLTGALSAAGVDVVQTDLSLGLFLRLFSQEWLSSLALPRRSEADAVRWLRQEQQTIARVAPLVVSFLQGRDPSLALRIVRGDLLPAGPRLEALEDEEEDLVRAFGDLGLQDRARFLATRFVDDVADAIKGGVDPSFALVRYAEQLAASSPTFEPIARWLDEETPVSAQIDLMTTELVAAQEPDLLGLSCPFPGNAAAAFRIARAAKRARPGLPVVLGGGWVNTELRGLKAPEVFDFVDFVTLDDGEAPLMALVEHLRGTRPREQLVRTFVRDEGAVRFIDTGRLDLPATPPTTRGLALDRYLSLLELPNPMHRLWSDVRWNKLTLAHGCYWKRCSFCDTSLDYIARYEPQKPKLIADWIEGLVAETGQRGFHFVDEAAPPALLRALSEELLRRQLAITWWTNIRFDKTFDTALAELMAGAGCVAVSGGLEVASDRLLALMEKGVTVAQVARVTHAFTEAGIMVHAYLMYGFPTETLPETVDALERVRQLFAEGCIQSAYWHRFTATVHSPIGRDPARYGITLLPRPTPVFAENDVPFSDSVGTDHDALGPALHRAVYGYMHGVGLDWDVRRFFPRGTPATTVPPDLVTSAIGDRG
jgi:radical SAM superfamily enzyme YgiQ (UPF0313 family)